MMKIPFSVKKLFVFILSLNIVTDCNEMEFSRMIRDLDWMGRNAIASLLWNKNIHDDETVKILK